MSTLLKGIHGSWPRIVATDRGCVESADRSLAPWSSREVAAQERCILLSCVSSDDEDEELEFRNLLYSWGPSELPTSIIEDSCDGMPECSSMSDLDYTLLDMTNAADLMLLVAHGA